MVSDEKSDSYSCSSIGVFFFSDLSKYLSLISWSLNIICLGIHFWYLSELFVSEICCLSIIWGDSQMLFLKTYLLFLLFFCIPIAHTLHLLKLTHSSWIFCYQIFLFTFEFWKFLSTHLHPHWFFPQLCPVWWWAHQRHPSFVALWFLVFPYDSSLEFSFLCLYSLPVLSCRPLLFIRPLSVLVTVIISQSDNSQICHI